eukprot:962314-Pelagomonas_calceolata.AAC.1
MPVLYWATRRISTEKQMVAKGHPRSTLCRQGRCKEFWELSPLPNERLLPWRRFPAPFFNVPERAGAPAVPPPPFQGSVRFQSGSHSIRACAGVIQ